jgi:hypothetical protein
MSESLSKVRGLSEKNDHEISMARSELEAISDKALKLSSMLQGKSDSDQLEAWVQSKITKAKDYINSVSDYMKYTPDMAMEKFDMKQYKRNEDENEHSLNALELVKMFGTPAEKNQMQGIYNAHMKRGHITPVDLRQRDKLNSKYYSKLKEDVDLNEFGLEGTITDKQLQNLKKVWSKKTMRDVTPGIKAMLKKLDAPTRAAIAHANINVISKIVPEEVELEEFNDAQVAVLKKSYADMKGKRISLANADKLRGIFNKFDGNTSALEKLVKADIPFVSDMAISRLISKHGYKADKLKQLRAGYNEDFTFDLESLTEQEDDTSKDKEIISKEQEISALKSKLELEKQKSVQKQTQSQINPETGEPLLKIGVAYKHLKDKMAKEKGKKVEEMAKDDAYAIGMAQAKKVMNDEPPLQKKTIKKGHEIADKILKKEETIKEYKKMTVTFKSMADMSKASTDLAKQGFTINAKGMVMKVDGKGDDLNKYGTDLQNFYKAKVVAEGFTSQQIKMAYGVANDKRYKGGNYSGAVKAIEKIAKGLSNHPDVQKVLKRTNENTNHPAKAVYEQIKGLKNKSEKSGMPYGILKKVYDRGMAAWRGGHRPGTTQQQWAFARVNSFVTKSSGTWGGADKDLAKQVKGSK